MKKICIICGKPTENEKSIEHIYPRALYKWSQYNLSDEDYKFLKKRIESKDNRGYSHYYCNLDKQDSLPKLEKLVLSDSKREAINKLSEEMTKYCKWFSGFKRDILSSQEGKCYHCGRNIRYGVLRRIDDQQPRTKNNGCIICYSCNRYEW